ncbi:MAG: FeoA family protein [Acidobacteriota bacterium]
MNTRPLTAFPPGSRGTVQRLLGGRGLTQKLAGLGLTVGAMVEVLQNYGRGPLIVSVRDTRIALGRGQAVKVLVEPREA